MENLNKTVQEVILTFIKKNVNYDLNQIQKTLTQEAALNCNKVLVELQTKVKNLTINEPDSSLVNNLKIYNFKYFFKKYEFIRHEYNRYNLDNGYRDNYNCSLKRMCATKWYSVKNGNIIRNFYPKTGLALAGGLGIVSWFLIDSLQNNIKIKKEEKYYKIKREKEEAASQNFNKGYDLAVKSFTQGKINPTDLEKYIPLILAIEEKKKLNLNFCLIEEKNNNNIKFKEMINEIKKYFD